MKQKVEYVVAVPGDLYRAARKILMAIGYDRKPMIDEAADELRAALNEYDGPEHPETCRCEDCRFWGA